MAEETSPGRISAVVSGSAPSSPSARQPVAAATETRSVEVHGTASGLVEIEVPTSAEEYSIGERDVEMLTEVTSLQETLASDDKTLERFAETGRAQPPPIQMEVLSELSSSSSSAAREGSSIPELVPLSPDPGEECVPSSTASTQTVKRRSLSGPGDASTSRANLEEMPLMLVSQQSEMHRIEAVQMERNVMMSIQEPQPSSSGALAEAFAGSSARNVAVMGEFSGGDREFPVDSPATSGGAGSGTDSSQHAVCEQFFASALGQNDADDELVPTVARDLCDFCSGVTSATANREGAKSSVSAEFLVAPRSPGSSPSKYVGHYCFRPRPQTPAQPHQPCLDCLSDTALKRIMFYLTLEDLCNNVQTLSRRMLLLANSMEVLGERVYVVRDSSTTKDIELVRFISKCPLIPGIIFLVPVGTRLLSELAERVKNLRRLEFSAGQEFNTPAMMKLLRMNPRINSLVVPNHALDDAEVGQKLLSYVQHLVNLYVTVGIEEYWSRVPMTVLAHFSFLTTISIPHLSCSVGDLKYFLIQKCNDLNDIEMSWQADRNVDFSLVKLLGICTNLNRLVTVDSNVGKDRDACFKALEGLKTLKELRLRQLSGVTSRILINFFSRAEFLDLRVLEISNVDVLTDTVAKAIIHRFKDLEELYLLDSNVMTGVGLSELSTLRDLSILSLSGTAQLTNESMVHVAKCKTLLELDVSYCGLVGPRGWEMLGGLWNLRHLTAKACDLRGMPFGTFMQMGSLRSLIFDLGYGLDLQSAKLLKTLKPWTWQNPVSKAHERGYYEERFGKSLEDYID